MSKNFTYETSSIFHWLKLEEKEPNQALLKRCTKETAEAAVADMENVAVISAELEEKTETRPACFHVTLSEAGYGTTPATVNVWCPLNWNGRYLACTGGGIRTFHQYEVMGKERRIAMPTNALVNGFATSNTDGGVPGELFSFGFDPKTRAIDYELILNLAYRSTHSMAVIAKKVITAVYGQEIAYSYIQGASGGGRQTMKMAQDFPEDFDGYWAVDPAINWTGLFTSGFWPVAVYNEEGVALSPKKQEFLRKQAVAQSGGKYDFIEDPDFVFDPYTCVGMDTEDGVLTEEDARIAKMLYDGPRSRSGNFMWYGFPAGTHSWSTGVLGEPGGIYYKETEKGWIPIVNQLMLGFTNPWIARVGANDKDWQDVDYKTFEKLFAMTENEMHCLECSNPDLYDLSQTGAKLLLTHAVNDDTIPSGGSLDYYRRAAFRMGGEEKIAPYFRLFMTPGGGHTDLVQPGISLTLSEGMTALMKWVEDGIEPTILTGVQYDFDQNAPILEGKVPRYRLGEDNKCFDVAQTPAYATKRNSIAGADSRFNENSTIREIKADPEGAAILEKHIGYLLSNPAMASAEGMSIEMLRKFMPQQSIKAKISACMEELFTLRAGDTSGGQKPVDRVYGKTNQ